MRPAGSARERITTRFRRAKLPSFPVPSTPNDLSCFAFSLPHALVDFNDQEMRSIRFENSSEESESEFRPKLYRLSSSHRGGVTYGGGSCQRNGSITRSRFYNEFQFLSSRKQIRSNPGTMFDSLSLLERSSRSTVDVELLRTASIELQSIFDQQSFREQREK